jgi:two-component sensor histidine kinase
MGYRLLNLLVRQIRGKLQVDQAAGASIAITFPVVRASEEREG